MASRSFSLPPLKVTKHSKGGSKSVSYINRSLPKCHSQEKLAPGSSPELMSPGFEEASEATVTEDPSTYVLEVKAIVKGWEQIRSCMLNASIEGAGMPSDVQCLVCKKVVAQFRCQSCGPGVFYCWNCFESCHRVANIFHVAEKWENGHFTAVSRVVHNPDVRPCHSYCTGKTVELDVVDEHCTSHKVRILCCDCEPLAATLSRANLWPASPTNPRLAFSVGLLDWVEALLLECQVALKDFCSALKFRNPFPILKDREIYGSLIDAFEEYRFMKHQIRQMNFCDEALDLGERCPACPQNNGKIVLAMDALFGLPRKKSAGMSYRSPLYGALHFLDQDTVDQYVSDYPKSKALATDCNDFVAGSMIRSANRYHRLDETAVYGYCCRHEFPGKFFNLKHGERLSYAVYMLEQILATHSNDQIFVMYDIACSLSQHLKLHKRTDILDHLDLSLPTFHCYGHKVSCQVQYSPRRCVGLGLSDGETMERLWSMLRRFSKMTKEMRPSHRIDILTSALLLYGAKTTKKLAALILSRYQRAVKTKVIAEESLHQFSKFTQRYF